MKANPTHSIMTELKKEASVDKSGKTTKDLICLLFKVSLQLHLVVVKLCSKNHDCFTRTNSRLTIHLRLHCVVTFPDISIFLA